MTPSELSQRTEELTKRTIDGPQTEINLADSVVRWRAKKTLLTTNDHDGTVQFESGFVVMGEGTIRGGELTMDMTSIVNSDQSGASKDRLETHLKSNDFFNVASFPTSQFIITSVTPLENSTFRIVGNLTIKGNTNEIIFPATVTSTNEAVLLMADIEIDRTLWDIRFGSGKFFDDLN